MLQQQQNLGQIFGTSKMHLSPLVAFGCSFQGSGSVVDDSMLIVAPIVGFCSCSMFMFCCVLLCVHFSFAIILMGKGELIDLRCLSS